MSYDLLRFSPFSSICTVQAASSRVWAFASVLSFNREADSQDPWNARAPLFGFPPPLNIAPLRCVSLSQGKRKAGH